MLPLTLSLPRGRPLRVLCLGAHADDIEIGCGGTVLELRRLRPAPRFQWVVLSATDRRAVEARLGAGEFAGSRVQVDLHEFRDGYFPAQYAEIKDVFESAVRRGEPDLILTHGRDDRHQDHRVVSELTWSTFRDHLVLEYEIPKWDGDLSQPNCQVPLARSIAHRKVQLLQRIFGTQRNKDWFDRDTFLGLMRLRGVECRAPSGYAEAFHARKTVLLRGR